MARHRKKEIVSQRRKRKTALILIELVILFILCIGLFITSKFGLIDRVGFDKNNTQNQGLDEDTQQLLQGYTDIALFGLDNREAGNYENGNSDVIMILSINNKTKQLAMVSVYRDTYLDISAKGEEFSFRKANASYMKGGAEQAITMLNNNLDLDIDEYISFDFQAVADAIDVLGGIEVEITDAELVHLNNYIISTNESLGMNSKQISGPGVHTLDGVQAVSYTRIRYTTGGDFKRAERQRIIIAAALDKAKTCDLKTLNKLVDVVFPEIETSMSAATMLQLVGAMMDYDLSQSQGFPFDRNAINHPTKGDIVVPCTLRSNVVELHRILYGNEDYEPSDRVEQYSDFIVEDTGQTGDLIIKDQYTLD